MTLAFLPSITATQEFVVPRSIPMTLLIDTSLQKQDRAARGSTVPIPREAIIQPSPDCGWGYICGRAGRYNRLGPMVSPSGRASFHGIFCIFGNRAALLCHTDHRRPQQAVE